MAICLPPTDTSLIPIPEDPTCCRTRKPLLHTHPRGRAPRARGSLLAATRESPARSDEDPAPPTQNKGTKFFKKRIRRGSRTVGSNTEGGFKGLWDVVRGKDEGMKSR